MGIKNILIAGLATGVIVSCASLTSLAEPHEGWYQDVYGHWYYVNSDGEYVTDDWIQIGDYWYYFDENRYCVMDTWALIDGKLYCFDKYGKMQSNTWIECEKNYDFAGDRTNWRYVGSDGAAYTGWHKVNGNWYYFYEGMYFYGEHIAEGRYDKLGYICYGDCYDVDDYLYHFDDNGHYISNTWYQNEDGDWYYYGSNGAAYGGWHQINGKWYLFGDAMSYSGSMCTGRVEYYCYDKYEIFVFDENGALQTGWIKTKSYDYDSAGNASWNGKYDWYYSEDDGRCYHSQWLNYRGAWYYFDNGGVMVTDVKDYYLYGKQYTFDANGKCTNPDNPKIVNGWCLVKAGAGDYSDKDYWTYVDNGNEYRDQWLNYRGDWYYFKTSYDFDENLMYSEMLQDVTDVEIDGRYYDFDEDGKCLNPGAIKITGWVKNGNAWNYYGDDGCILKEKWLHYNNKWYYFDWSGRMCTGVNSIRDEKDGQYKQYFFTNSGDMITGWYNSDYGWVYADSNGELYVSKWLNYKGEWYYFEYAYMVADRTNVYIDGKYYDFGANGICINPYSGRIKRIVVVN